MRAVRKFHPRFSKNLYHAREAPRLDGAAHRLLLLVGLRPLGTKRKGDSIEHTHHLNHQVPAVCGIRRHTKEKVSG